MTPTAETILAERKAEAERRHRTRITEQYPEGVPWYKDEGTPEWEDCVEREALHITYEIPSWTRPISPFEDPLDWTYLVWADYALDGKGIERLVYIIDGQKHAGDLRLERSLHGKVAEATAHHDETHGGASHPWCLSCEVRLARSSVEGRDVRNAGLTDGDIEEMVRPEVIARIRGWALRSSGPSPKVVPPEPFDEEAQLFFTVDDLRQVEPPEMLIPAVLPACSYGLLTGRDGTYKTFGAIDMSLTLATGKGDYHGQPVDEYPRGVLFLAGEGSSAFHKRVDSWCSYHGIDPEGVPLTIVPKVPDLYAGGGVYEAVLEWVAQNQPALIIVDTLRRASGGADQNSARDMGMVVDRLHALKEASGGTVLVVAHTDKGDNDARGSSAIEDDADFVVKVKVGNDGAQTLSVEKMKDGPDDFTMTTWPTAVGESIVMADQSTSAAVRWSSTTNRSRVIAALRWLPAEAHSSTDIAAATGQTGDPIARGTVHRELQRLQVEDKAVEKVGPRWVFDQTWEESID